MSKLESHTQMADLTVATPDGVEGGHVSKDADRAAGELGVTPLARNGRVTETMQEPPPLPNVIEPGTAFCTCGQRMAVKAVRLQEYQYPKGEVAKFVRQHRPNRQQMRQWQRQFPYVEVWGLEYKCPACGLVFGTFRPSYGEEEAHRIVARASEEARPDC